MEKLPATLERCVTMCQVIYKKWMSMSLEVGEPNSAVGQVIAGGSKRGSDQKSSSQGGGLPNKRQRSNANKFTIDRGLEDK